ncbi:hypothetical protein A2765_03675 [Candidatus Kaiserbacteria bacterium RIFCSPHIGHO2_01_FULL_56_24]|uniref:Uncharacterized protein n=1 Tax=Candidatus Kaiserbacteria bacterium RIFCSPHIGHO2_01_FULL_56_24 TaxID=1798487 RepID=A0A1F6DH58_9BACT|nr:MAG: hypothetical protein A2765_03675 [Candidatus Kaiserbacteria bacterium RIFCSPHIGHO2_01_FULL_56_24]
MFTYYRFSRLRILLAIACAFCAVFAPWWATLIFAILLNLRFRAWEVILIGLFMDLYWMPFSVSFFSFDSLPLATIVAVVLVFGFEPLRRQLLVGPEIL